MAAIRPITRKEFDARTTFLTQHLRTERLTGVVLFDPSYVLYYTGFAYAPTERPIAFILNANGDRALFVPRLEVEHVGAKTGFERVDSYLEYPGEEHPMSGLVATMADMGLTGKVAADTDGYPWVYGYEGPTLSDVSAATIVPIARVIEAQMMVKSEAEIDLLRASTVWGNLAHVLLQRYTRVGETETEVTDRATTEATRAMTDALGSLYQSQSLLGDGAFALYRGQVGRNSAIPHALAGNLTFQPGDVLVTGASAPMWGYISELERTMIMGLPSDEQRRLFEFMVGAQDTAMNAMQPGHTCSDVDRAVRSYYEEHDLMPSWRHHTGHGLGIRNHNPPFLDIGDHTPLRPGMVFSVEPGLYVTEYGGFRHSDTVLITEDGNEMLTYYPRDIESLTIPV